MRGLGNIETTRPIVLPMRCRLVVLVVAMSALSSWGCSDSGSQSSSSLDAATGDETRPTSAGDEADAGSEGSPDSDGPSPQCPVPFDVDFVDGLELLGRGEGDTFIEILDVVAREDVVYACTGTQGLTLWDATDGAEPILLAENAAPPGLAHPSFPRCQHVALSDDGSTAVITNRGDEVQPTPWLWLLDVSDPSAPMPVRGWSGTVSIEGAIIDGSRIYAAAHTRGILVFEDDGGQELSAVTGYSDAQSDAWQVVRDGATLFAAEGTTGLRIYDLAEDGISLRSSLRLPGSSLSTESQGRPSRPWPAIWT